MIQRNISAKVRSLARKFPVVTITGPRQSGKSTLIKNLFPKKPYVSLEDPDMRQLALDDPRGFLNNYPNGAILDEVQNIPSLFSYIQGIVDNKNKAGMYIISGSQNFLLMEKITQTLAGRTAICQLLPLSKSELGQSGKKTSDINALIYRGFYPRLYDKKINPVDFYASYLKTYIERDVRQIRNITDHSLFLKFLKMCAARMGSVLNIHSLANDCGISLNTAKSWLSVLETGYVIYLLQPYHNNFNKRLMKSPKLYFYDTGLVCYLLGIANSKDIAHHYLRGGLFENLVVADTIKYFFNQAQQPPIFYWKDKTQKEIDLIIDKGRDKLTAIEIKAGETITKDYFANFPYWNKITNSKPEMNKVIYAGEKQFQTESGQYIPFELYENIIK